jgi:hypothetical protein
VLDLKVEGMTGFGGSWGEMGEVLEGAREEDERWAREEDERWRWRSLEDLWGGS